MMPPNPAYARLANTRGSRVNDPSFERYLREEFLGGGAAAELMPNGSEKRSTVRGTFVRIVKAVLLDRNRLKPAPAPAGL